MKYCVLFNPLSANKRSGIYLEQFKEEYKDNEIDVIDVVKLENVISFLTSLEQDVKVVLMGGDGTLNHFVNSIKDYSPINEIYLYASGTGNDFLNDVRINKSEKLFLINKYINNLPKVIINDEETLFINGIGYGIDGYVCTEGIKQEKKRKKEANYTAIAVKLLLFKYKPRNAVITVDGVKMEFKKVWLASSMKGRFYGSGMMVAPNQDRLDGYVSFVCVSKAGKFKILRLFPSIFKGKHVKYEKLVTMIKGKEIVVEFDKPCDLQIDGEVRYGVKKYIVKA